MAVTPTAVVASKAGSTLELNWAATAHPTRWEFHLYDAAAGWLEQKADAGVARVGSFDTELLQGHSYFAKLRGSEQGEPGASVQSNTLVVV